MAAFFATFFAGFFTAFLAAFFVVFLAAFFATFFAGRFTLFGAASAAGAEETDRFVERELGRHRAARHGRVHASVSDVRAVATFQHAHRRAAVGVGAELGDRRLLLAAAPLLRLRVQRLGFLERHREQLFLAGQAARVAVVALQVGAEPARRRDDLAAFAVGADDAWSASNWSASSNVTVSGVCDANSDDRFGFFFEPGFLVAELHVRTEPAGEHVDRELGVGIGAQHLRPLRLLLDELERQRHRQLVGRDLGRQRRGLVVGALHVRAVPPDPHDDLVAGVVLADRDRAHAARVDGRELFVGDELAEAGRAVAEVEGVEPLLLLAFAPAMTSSASSIVAVKL